VNDLRRVVWRYAAQGLWVAGAAPPDTEATTEQAAPLLEGIETVGGVLPVVPGSRAAVRGAALSIEALEDQPALDLASYFHCYPVGEDSAQQLAERLRNEPAVDEVEIRTRPVTPYWYDPGPEGLESVDAAPPAAPSGFSAQTTPSFFAYQRYLGPDGFDVLPAWTVGGGRGEGVHVLDVETRWNLGHEEHDGRARVVIGGPWGSASDRDHGTAVLGILSAEDKGAGIIGMAPSSLPRAGSVVWDPAPATGRWNVENLLVQVPAFLPAGTVVLLELQERGPRTPATGNDQFGMLPVERWPSTWAAIRTLVAKGYHVVEAAGNGNQNLDDAIYGETFSRNRDSGAILVGAGNSAFRAVPRSRCDDFSNFGERLDVQGWGNDVATSGGPLSEYRDLHPLQQPFDAWRCYTRSFGGTSGASALVAGAVACVAGAARLDPSDMRSLLVSTGKAQTASAAAPASEQIGPLPQVAACLRGLGLLF